jgi:hypothetical protein
LSAFGHGDAGTILLRAAIPEIAVTVAVVRVDVVAVN